MQTGEVEANLLTLNEEAKLGLIDELIASKQVAEKNAPEDLDWDFHASELDRLEEELEHAFEVSRLPENRDRDAVNELLVGLRLGEIVVT